MNYFQNLALAPPPTLTQIGREDGLPEIVSEPSSSRRMANDLLQLAMNREKLRPNSNEES